MSKKDIDIDKIFENYNQILPEAKHNDANDIKLINNILYRAEVESQKEINTVQQKSFFFDKVKEFFFSPGKMSALAGSMAVVVIAVVFVFKQEPNPIKGDEFVKNDEIRRDSIPNVIKPIQKSLDISSLKGKYPEEVPNKYEESSTIGFAEETEIKYYKFTSYSIDKSSKTDSIKTLFDNLKINLEKSNYRILDINQNIFISEKSKNSDFRFRVEFKKNEIIIQYALNGIKKLDPKEADSIKRLLLQSGIILH